MGPEEPARRTGRRTVLAGARVTVVAAAAAVVAGCAAGPTGTAPPSVTTTSSPTAADAANPVDPSDQEYRYTGYAIGPTGSDEATLCGSLVLQSLPPVCGDGVTVRGWDWSRLGAETADGVSFGEVEVVVTWDAATTTLTVSRPLEPYEPPAPRPQDDQGHPTPCPEPAGGWESLAPTDPARSDFDAAFAAVVDVEGYLIAWMGRDPGTARPTYAVLNARTAGDVAAMEAAAREHWSGPLCVTGGAQRSAAQLAAIRDEVEAAHPELVPLNLDEWRGLVVGTTWVVPDGLHAELDAAHGEGTVEVRGFLEPVG